MPKDDTQFTGTADNKSENIKPDVNESDIQYVERLLSGDDPHIERLATQYMLNLLKNTDPNSATAYRMCVAYEQILGRGDEDIGFPSNKDKDDKKPYYKDTRYAKRNAVDAKDWKIIKEYYENKLTAIPDEPPQAIFTNLMKLADHLELSPLEKDTLSILYAVNGNLDLQFFLEKFLKADREKIPAVFARMNDSPEKVRELYKVLDVSAPLSSYGLINLDEEITNTFYPEIEPYLRESISEPGLDVNSIVRILLGSPAESELELKDFEHVGEDLAFVAKLIKTAVEKGETGINILLHGNPGGGKTALAAALSKELGYKMYAVAEDDEANAVSMPGQTSQRRLSQLLRAQALLKGSDKTILLFDEIEDLLLKGTDSQKKADTDSKIQINRLLESNPVVTIWAGNDPDKFHEAVRQRFTYSLHMGQPPTLVRKKIWERRLSIQNLELEDKDVLELARKYAAPPRMIAKAARSAAMIEGDINDIEKSLASDARISMGHRQAIHSHSRVPKKYDLDLINIGEDAEKKVNDIIKLGKDDKSFALFVKGEEGCGVASTLRYISEGMSLNPLEVSAADLIRPTQFSSPEQNIASAFLQAANDRSFLIIHDVESFAVNPNSAKDWKEGLASVFAHYARKHNMPFAVSSQANVDLPDIFTHRFSHQMEFKPLTSKQAKKAYKTYFGKEASKKLNEGYVLSDFTNVERIIARSSSSSETYDFGAIVKQLDKQKHYRGTQSNKVGIKVNKNKVGIIPS